METYYAAVDMGASSGRLILGHMENGRSNSKKSIVLRMEMCIRDRPSHLRSGKT